MTKVNTKIESENIATTSILGRDDEATVLLNVYHSKHYEVQLIHGKDEPYWVKKFDIRECAYGEYSIAVNKMLVLIGDRDAHLDKSDA